MAHTTRVRACGALAVVALGAVSSCGGDAEIRGVVSSADGPVAGAIVRVQTTARHTSTRSDGQFVLPTTRTADEPLALTAWAPGYYCAGPVEAWPGETAVTLSLEAHATADHPEYEWLPSIQPRGATAPVGCSACHSRAGTDLPFTLPADEWLCDAHAQSAVNPRFLTMYTGTDIHGNASPPRQYGYDRDYGRVPLPPDVTEPYYGPGYVLDFPDTAGNCAACHTPVAAVDHPYDTDPTVVQGVGAEGVACDFCHKVWDVHLDETRGLPHDHRPGVLSFELRRPPPGHQFFAGPFDDVAPGEDTFSPVMVQSQFCAPCHYGVFWDTVVYNSYGEWRDSPYSDPVHGRSCQDCHMPRRGATHFAAPAHGGLARDPLRIRSHDMLGAADPELLENAVALAVSARRDNHRLLVTVAVTNDQTGHHVPTDSPLRHLILRVEVRGQSGPASQIAGPRLPSWCGVGAPATGAYAGLPGKAFARILEELWTEVAPTGAYWLPTRVVSDNRLAAFATDTSDYTFMVRDPGAVQLDVTLLFRRAFYDLIQSKGWDVPDIVMEHTRMTIEPSLENE